MQCFKPITLTLSLTPPHPGDPLQRLKEADLIRTMKAKEVQERFSYIKERAAAAAEADEHRRQTYAERLAVSRDAWYRHASAGLGGDF